MNQRQEAAAEQEALARQAATIEAEREALANTCFCGEPLTQGNWCGCAEGQRRLEQQRQHEAAGLDTEYTDPAPDPHAETDIDDPLGEPELNPALLDLSDRPDYDDDDDDDPTCVCGTARSEHRLCGCPEGFQTPASWAIKRAAIIEAVRRDREDRDYDGADDCDQGSDYDRREEHAGHVDGLMACEASDADIGQLAATQEWQAHQNALGRIFDTQ